jgi:ubiquitin-protein ligase
VNEANAMQVMKSVTALEANLPIAWHSSVHVAVDEDRQDVMRVLILPDQDTPYANGAFVLDMFLPELFPEVPPKVRSGTIISHHIVANFAVLNNLVTDMAARSVREVQPSITLQGARLRLL